MAMSRREKVFLATLVAVAGVAGVVLGLQHWRGSLAPNVPETVPIERHSATTAELDEIRGFLDAEKNSDGLQRCLTYPNPSGFQWDAKVVDAFCRLSLRKMIAPEQITTALDEHHSEILQQAFDSYLDDNFEHGHHGFLIWTYRIFQNSSPQTEAVAQQWVNEDPNSAYALAARGMHYVAAAGVARGEKISKDTPKENFARMHELLDKASADFHEALRRNGKLIAAYHGMFQIAQLRGDSNLRQSAANDALKLDSADQWIYDDWFDSVEPKWGGSPLEMQGVVEEAMKHVDDNPLLERIRARPMCYAAETTWCANCGHESEMQHALQALRLFEQAASNTPATCFLRSAPYSAEVGGDDVSLVRYASQAYRFLGDEEQALRRALALQRLGKSDWGLESIERMLSINPRNVAALTHRGWLLEGMGRSKEAEQTFLTVVGIDPTNRYANSDLVHLYLDEMKEPEKAADVVNRFKVASPKNPRAWLLEAALHKPGDDAACRDALQRYLELVNQSGADAYEQRDIVRAKSRLAELNQKLNR